MQSTLWFVFGVTTDFLLRGTETKPTAAKGLSNRAISTLAAFIAEIQSDDDPHEV